MTTSPEALREAVERATANLSNTAWTPRRAHYEGMRNQLAAAEAALQEAREALGPFSEAFLTLSSRWQDHEEDWQHALHRPINVGQLRRAAEVYRALSPGRGG